MAILGSGGAICPCGFPDGAGQQLPKILFLQFVGGLLLVWIAYQLLVKMRTRPGQHHHDNLWVPSRPS